MFLRLLIIPWFIMTIVPAFMTTDINTTNYVTDQAESSVLPDTTVPSWTPEPPTLDTSAQFSSEPALVSVDSVTSAALPGHGTMETGLIDGYSPVSSSTSTKSHSATPVTHSNWISMDMIRESEHSSLTSPTSPGSNLSSPVTDTVWVSMDIATSAFYSPIVSPTSPENDATIIKSTSEYVAIETTTGHINTISPTSSGFDLNTSTPQGMGSSVTVEEIKNPTHDHLVSSASPENDAGPTKTPKNVTTDPELSSGFFSGSTSENVFSNPATNQMTMETATAYIPIASSAPKETYSTAVTNTGLNTMETIAGSPHNPVSMSSEMNSDGYVKTSFQTTMETHTAPTNKAGVSLTKNESTMSYQVTIEDVTSTIYNPGISQTSQEDAHISTVTYSTQVTQQKVTTPVHSHISSTSRENHFGTTITTSDHITMETTADIPTATSISLESYSTIPGSTLNQVTVETMTNFSDKLTVFPTSKNDFSAPTSDYTAYIPVESSGAPSTDFSTPVGTSTKTVTTSVHSPIESTTSLTDTDTTFPQGPATTQGSENTSVTELPGRGTSKMSTKQSPATPVDQATTVMTEISVTTVAGPTGPPAGILNETDAPSIMATVTSDQPTNSTVTTTTMLVPINSTGIPEQSSSSPTELVTRSTMAPATTRSPVRPGAGFCPSNPCPFNSVCLELVTSFSCLCLAGSYFSGGRCVQARVFPGTLHIKMLEFQSEMSNRSSQAFQEVAAVIAQELGMALMDQPGYVKTTVQELREGSVVASVDNIFKLGSNATKQSTIGAIYAAIQDCVGNCGLLTRAKFSATDLCKQQLAPCDLQTTNCVFQDNGTAKCICKEGYIPSLYSNTSCAVCLSGERSENGKCVACPFGYGGFNCHDSYLLAVVVTSCVLGSLLLILLLAFISYCLRRPPRKSSYHSPYPSDELSSVWPHQGFTHIPRASSNWDPTQMEMIETSNPGSQPDSKLQGNGAMESYSVVPEDMRTFKGKNSSRYSYLIQGHQNPYFIADEIKRAT